MSSAIAPTGRLLAREVPGPGLVAGVGVLLVLLGTWGVVSATATIGVAIAVVAALALCAVRRRPAHLRLLDAWLLGFVYLFASDLAVDGEITRRFFGPSTAAASEGFLSAAFGASLLGYAAVMRSPRPSASASARILWLTRDAASRRRPLPHAGVVWLTVLDLAVLAFVFVVSDPRELFLHARIERTLAPGPLRLPFIAATIVQPLVLLYLRRVHRIAPGLRRVSTLVALLAVLALAASGTRFYLGYLLCGAVVLTFDPLRRIAPGRLPWLIAIALVGLLAQGVIRQTRASGFGDNGLAELVEAIARPETFLSREGLLRVNAWVHDKQAYATLDRPPENAFILYWWVPRSLWPDKPTMDGNWLITEVMDDGHFPQSHSVAAGFSMPALIDLGPWWGLLCCVLYGAVVGALERFTRRHLDPRDPWVLLACLCPFGVFFTVRGLHLAAIFAQLCFLWIWPVIRMETRWRRAQLARGARRAGLGAANGVRRAESGWGPVAGLPCGSARGGVV